MATLSPSPSPSPATLAVATAIPVTTATATSPSTASASTAASAMPYHRHSANTIAAKALQASSYTSDHESTAPTANASSSSASSSKRSRSSKGGGTGTAGDGSSGSAGSNDFPKLKKPSGAYHLFIADKRHLTVEAGVSDLGQQNKLLSDMWKNLSDTEKQHYVDENIRLQREYEAAVRIQNEAAARSELNLTQHLMSHNPLHYTIDIDRVKKLLGLDDDVIQITKEAVALVAKSCEEFVAWLSRRVAEVSFYHNKRTLRESDFEEALASRYDLMWLRAVIKADPQGLTKQQQLQAASHHSTNVPANKRSRSMKTAAAAAAAGASNNNDTNDDAAANQQKAKRRKTPGNKQTGAEAKAQRQGTAANGNADDNMDMLASEDSNQSSVANTDNIDPSPTQSSTAAASSDPT
jgi:hypothetical protein